MLVLLGFNGLSSLKVLRVAVILRVLDGKTLFFLLLGRTSFTPRIYGMYEVSVFYVFSRC